MKFFLPLATSAEQAERVYSRIADRLNNNGYYLKSDRIHEVIYKQGGSLRSETVGVASHNGELVLAIFKNDTDYFICTYSTGAVWGEPVAAHYLLVETVDYFEE